VKAHKSALKHGISENDGIYAAQHRVYTAGLDDDNPAREFRLGFDPNGRLQHSPQGVVCDPVSGIPYRRRTSDITYRIHRVTSGSAGFCRLRGVVVELGATARVRASSAGSAACSAGERS
jgi:hypothetical protein